MDNLKVFLPAPSFEKINDWINDWKLLFQNRRDSMSIEVTEKQEDIIKPTV